MVEAEERREEAEEMHEAVVLVAEVDQGTMSACGFVAVMGLAAMASSDRYPRPLAASLRLLSDMPGPGLCLRPGASGLAAPR